MHELVQRRLGSTGKLFGLWECSVGVWKRDVHYGFKPEKVPTEHQHKVEWEYKEVQLLMKNWNIR